MMNRILRSRSLEFMVLGGASILVAGGLLLLEWSGKKPFLSTRQKDIAFAFMVLAYVVNYPHALWSYRLAYRQGGRFVVHNWFSLIFIPVSLVLVVLIVAAAWARPILELPNLIALDSALEGAGIFLNISLYSSVGKWVFAYLLIFQMIASSRHYALQSLGIGLTYAHKHQYPISKVQKQWLRANVTALWVLSILWGYQGFTLLRNMDFEYFSPRFPYYAYTISFVLFAVTTLGVLYFIVLKNYLQFRKLPPLNVFAAIFSVYLWLQPFWWPFGYQVWIVPIAHCIQYLFFCFHAERGEDLQSKKIFRPNRNWLRYGVIAAALVPASYLIFDYLPHHFDYLWFGYFMTANIGVVGINVVINIHHYFIDAVVWRNPKSTTRKQLILSLYT